MNLITESNQNDLITNPHISNVNLPSCVNYLNNEFNNTSTQQTSCFSNKISTTTTANVTITTATISPTIGSGSSNIGPGILPSNLTYHLTRAECAEIHSGNPSNIHAKINNNDNIKQKPKKNKTGFKLSRNKKHKNLDASNVIESEWFSNKPQQLENEVQQSNVNKISRNEKKKSSKSKISNKHPVTISCFDDSFTMNNVYRNSSMKNIKKKHNLKLKSDKTNTEQNKIPSRPVFGVSLEIAINHNPSHDDVKLPAFFRHCIDYIEQYGLSTKGIYRVPGVHSQVQALISALNSGQEFPDILPTSATFYQDQEFYQKLINNPDLYMRGKCKNLSTGNQGDYRGSSSGQSSNAPTRNFIGSPSKSAPYPWSDSRNYAGDFALSRPPHDPAVVASVIKYFLRNLPEPVLTKRLSSVMESLPVDNLKIYHNLATLVHHELPLANRYLLAWLIQHMMRIIDHAGENLMTLDNLSIVMSPCVGISHRLLAVLLNPAPTDFHLDLCELDPELPSIQINERTRDPYTWHWLFPHPTYLLNLYKPPLKPMKNIELPDQNDELDKELKKQESLLNYLHEQIKSGQSTVEKESLLWEVQLLITEIKRRKSLTDPDAVRAELIRQQAQLDKLHKFIAQNTDTHSDNANTIENGSAGLNSGSSSQRRPRITGGQTKHSKTNLKSSSEIPYSDELWEVQRQITMLKRRLKQLEKSNTNEQGIVNHSQANISSSVNMNKPDTTTSSNQLVYMFGKPLVIPSLAELDQEEELNLTLRKLPFEATTSTIVPGDQNDFSLSDQKINAKIKFGCESVDCKSEIQSVKINCTNENKDIVEESVEKSKHTENVNDLTQDHQKIDDIKEIDQLKSMNLTDEVNIINTESFVHLTTQHDVRRSSEKPSDDESLFTEQKEKSSECLPQIQDCSSIPQSEQSCSSSPKSMELMNNPIERQVSQQVSFYKSKKQELLAIQTDLLSRIRSENAEIQRLQSCIHHLLETGGKRARRIYQTQIAAKQLCPVWLYDKPDSLSDEDSTSLMGINLDLSNEMINQPWSKLADQLTEDQQKINRYLLKNHSTDSDNSELDKKSLSNEEPQDLGVSYERLTEEEEEEEQGRIEEYMHIKDDHDEVEINGSEWLNKYDILDSEITSPNKINSTDYNLNQTMYDENADDEHDDDDEYEDDNEIDDDEEDDDDDNNTCEVELARTLHQLTLDNARLEQLNARSLEAIQAERNRCADLKVLLRLRSTSTDKSTNNIVKTNLPGQLFHKSVPLSCP